MAGTALVNFLAQTIDREEEPIEVALGLRRAAWLAFVPLGVLAGGLWWVRARPLPLERPSFFIAGWELVRSAIDLRGQADLVLAAAMAGVFLLGVLALMTAGFRTAAAWVQVAVLVVVAVGVLAAIPLVAVMAVAAVNLALWILYAAVMVAIGVFAVMMIGAALASAWE